MVKPVKEAPKQSLEQLYSLRFLPTFAGVSLEEYVGEFRLILVDDVLFYTGDLAELWPRLQRLYGSPKNSLSWWYMADAIVKDGKVLKNRYGYVTN